MKRWSYPQLTEHAEQQIRSSMELASEAEEDRERRRIHKNFAFGAYNYWSSLTMGWQAPGDDHRLWQLMGRDAEYCPCASCIQTRHRAADSVKPPGP